MNRSDDEFNQDEKNHIEAEGSDDGIQGHRVTSYLSRNLADIGHLKIVIQEKGEKISELYVTLESKDKEMEVLKAQIEQLEGEKIILEARSQESQLADVPKDVAELKEAKGNLERKNLVFEEEIKDLNEQTRITS